MKSDMSYLVILMVILFLIFFLQHLDKFETSSTVKSLIENKVDSMIGDSHLDTNQHQLLLKTHSELVESNRNTNQEGYMLFSYS